MPTTSAPEFGKDEHSKVAETYLPLLEMSQALI